MKSILAILFALGVATAAVLKKDDTGKIVGGYAVEKGDHPYQAHLQLTISYWGIFTQTVWGCGGSIINEKWILTAAHCVFDQSGRVLAPTAIKVRTGQHDSSILESHAVNHNVIRVIPHAQFNPRNFANDVAVLELATAVQFNDHTAAIPLVAQDYIPAHGSEVLVSGWGNTGWQGASSAILRAVAVHIVEKSTCNVNYAGAILPGMICAAADGKDSCQGDSGGPLVEPDASGVHRLTGVVSWGNACADPNFPGVYASVGEYVSWIEANTGLDF